MSDMVSLVKKLNECDVEVIHTGIHEIHCEKKLFDHKNLSVINSWTMPSSLYISENNF